MRLHILHRLQVCFGTYLGIRLGTLWATLGPLEVDIGTHGELWGASEVPSVEQIDSCNDLGLKVTPRIQNDYMLVVLDAVLHHLSLYFRDMSEAI